MNKTSILDQDYQEQNVPRKEWDSKYGGTNNPSGHSEDAYGYLDYPVSLYYLDLYKTHMRMVRWHWHEEMEILIINDGIAEISTEDAVYTINPGEGVIINQNVMHSIHSHDENNCTFYSFVFHPNFLFGYKRNYLQTQFLLPIQSLNLFKIFVLNEKNEWHKNMIDAINDAIAVNVTKPFGYELATKGHLCHFWSLLVGRLPQIRPAPRLYTSLDEQRVKQAILFIQTHHTEPLSLNDIADSIHISKSECCRCFSRTLQMTPFEYLMKYRIFEATKLLLNKTNDSISIADLASSVGFNNTSYFNKLFKKFLGCTPTYYRNNHVLSKEKNGNGPFSIPLP